MCLGIPAQVVEARAEGIALADVGGVRREISVALVEDGVRPGDWVLVHVGFALGRIDEEEAQATLALLDEAERLLGGVGSTEPPRSAGAGFAGAGAGES
jgi:hydrogenase expression/formation protein HypC